MAVWAWVAVFVAWTLFDAWMVFGSGASWLEDNWLAAFLVDWIAVGERADRIKVYAACAWVLTACWFAVGLFVPAARSFWLLS